MRVAVYHNLYSGGAKRAAYEISRQLSPRHQLDTYSLSCSNQDFADLRPFSRQTITFPFEPLPLARSPFGRVNQVIRMADLLRLRSLQKQIAAQIDDKGYDVVLAHNCQFGQAPAILSYLKTPSVYFCNEPPRNIYEPVIARPYLHTSRRRQLLDTIDPFHRLYLRMLASLDAHAARSATVVMANSAFSREGIYKSYGISARILTLGIDSQHFKPLSLPKRDFFISVGAVRANKGYDFLIRSLAHLPTAERLPLVVISNFADPPELAYLQDLARHLEVKVDFRFMVSDEQIVSSYNQARLTLYSPVMEPLGFVPLESMACGTPVVGVNEGGVRETVIHGVNGLLSDRDPQEFAETVLRLVHDPDCIAEYSRNGRSMVEKHWRWENSARIVEKCFEQALKVKTLKSYQ